MVTAAAPTLASLQALIVALTARVVTLESANAGTMQWRKPLLIASFTQTALAYTLASGAKVSQVFYAIDGSAKVLATNPITIPKQATGLHRISLFADASTTPELTYEWVAP